MKRHEFTKGHLRWGWNILSWTHDGGDSNSGSLMAVGRGVKVGDELTMTFGTGTAILNVDSIEYHRNPTDLFDARLTMKEFITDTNK